MKREPADEANTPPRPCVRQFVKRNFRHSFSLFPPPRPQQFHQNLKSWMDHLPVLNAVPSVVRMPRSVVQRRRTEQYSRRQPLACTLYVHWCHLVLRTTLWGPHLSVAHLWVVHHEVAVHVSYFITLYIIMRWLCQCWQIESLEIGEEGVFYESLVWTVQNFCANCILLRPQTWRFESSVNSVIGFGDSS